MAVAKLAPLRLYPGLYSGIVHHESGKYQTSRGIFELQTSLPRTPPLNTCYFSSEL